MLALALILVFLTVNNASAEVSVGVKAGDWIEYEVLEDNIRCTLNINIQPYVAS